MFVKKNWNKIAILPLFGLLVFLIVLVHYSISYAVLSKDYENIDNGISVDEYPTIYMSLNGVTLDQINAGSKDIKYPNNDVTIKEGDTSLNYSKVEIKGRGNTTWGKPKKPYQIKFDEKVSLFGLGKSKKWVLLANWFDLSNMRNDSAFFAARTIGMKNTWDGKFVNFVVDGKYIGTYWVTHKVEIGKSAVNIGDDGIIFESDFRTPDDISFISNIEHRQFVFSDYGNDDENKKLRAISSFQIIYNQFEAALYSGDWESVKKLIDIDSFVDYLLLSELTSNADAFATSFYFYRNDSNDVLHLGPPWDYDLAYGNYPGTTQYNNEYMSRLYYEKFSTLLMNFPEFRGAFIEKFNVLKMAETDILNRNNEILLENKIQLDRNALTWGRNLPEQEVDKLNDWIFKRFDYLKFLYQDSVQIEDNGLYKLTSQFGESIFFLNQTDDGYFTVMNEENGKYLDVYNSSIAIDAEVGFWDYNGNDNQKWCLSERGGKCYLISKMTGFCLCFEDKLKISKYSSSESQKFVIESLNKEHDKGNISLDEKQEFAKIDVIHNGNNNVCFKVWSENKGFINSHTYQGIYQGDNKYESIIPVADFGATGRYWIWIYVQDGQSSKAVAYNSFSIDTILCESIVVGDLNGNTLSFSVSVNKIVSRTNINSLDVYVWHNNSSRAYAKKYIITNIQKGDDYYYGHVSVPISDFNYNYGTFFADVNANGSNGICVNLGSASGHIFIEKDIADGNYVLSSIYNSHFVLDVQSGSKFNNGNIILWDFNRGNNQKWNLKKDTDGWYVIKNINSGLVLDIEGGRLYNGANICQYQYNGGDNQKWKFSYQQDGCKIVSKLSTNYVIDICGNSIFAGANILLFQEHSGYNQIFNLCNLSPLVPASDSSINDGYYMIGCASNNAYVLDIPMSSKDNGVRPIIWSKSMSAPNQIFYIRKLANGYHCIECLHSGKVLDSSWGDVLPGTEVLQWEHYISAENQMWSIRKSENNYVIENVASGLVLEIYGGKCCVGSNICLYTSHSGENQIWSLIPVNFDNTKIGKNCLSKDDYYE